MASTKEMREWLRSQGVTVGERGRLHPTAIKKYNLAHQAPLPKSVEHKLMDAPQVPAQRNGKRSYYPCGWCNTGDHESCRGEFQNGSNAVTAVVYCKCYENGH